MEIKLDGRAAVITGASKGLGLAIATRMAASGADVALLARRADVLEAAREAVSTAARGRVVGVSCDVSDAKEIARAYEEVMARLGRVDILVNNAGTSQTGAFPTISDEVWQADLDLKLFAAIRLARLTWPQMAERHWGRIINVLNIGAKAPNAAAKQQKSAKNSTDWRQVGGIALTVLLWVVAYAIGGGL